MRKYRIVTAEQRKKYKKPDCVELFNDKDKTWGISVYGCYLVDQTYRVPADFKDWELIEPEIIHAIDHVNRSYCEIDVKQPSLTWHKVTCEKCLKEGLQRSQYKTIIKDRMNELGIDIPEPEQPQFKTFEIRWVSIPMVGGFSAAAFPRIDGYYQVFGFTNIENWETGEPYSDTPTYSEGLKYKYAIGRLEV